MINFEVVFTVLYMTLNIIGMVCFFVYGFIYAETPMDVFILSKVCSYFKENGYHLVTRLFATLLFIVLLLPALLCYYLILLVLCVAVMITTIMYDRNRNKK